MANSDGCGFAFANLKKKVVEIYKTMDFDDFCWHYYEAYDLHPGTPFLLHFRIRTSGTTDEFNCHPFQISNTQAFIHNGIISHVSACPDKKRNDTQMFNEEILKALPSGWEDNRGIRQMIEQYIGYSKICVLNADGKTTIFNEAKGEWENGIWWSNASYKPRPAVTVYNNYNNHNRNRNLPLVVTPPASIYGITKQQIGASRSSIPSYYKGGQLGTVVCDMCNQDEKLHLSRTVLVNNVEIEVCRDCVKVLTASETLFYDVYDKDGWAGDDYIGMMQ